MFFRKLQLSFTTIKLFHLKLFAIFSAVLWKAAPMDHSARGTSPVVRDALLLAKLLE